MRRTLSFVLALLVCGCTTGDGDARQFSEAGISLRYPKAWHVTGFSTKVSPPRLAVSSFPVPAEAVEGDCGGHAAVELLPPDGALVLLIDYGERGGFPPRPSPLTMASGKLAEYECFGRSWMFRFRLDSRDLQAHLGLGSKADEAVRRDALSILTSIEVED